MRINSVHRRTHESNHQHPQCRLHNLKNVDLEIPRNQLVVLTGISGSGKSTLAFDILNKEGQRQHLESLGFVTDGLSKPPVDSITGLSPTISVDQHLTNHNPRSTVGTVTEVFTCLRLLFARLGHRPCPECGRDVPPIISLDSAGDWQEDTDEAPGANFPVHTAVRLFPSTAWRTSLSTSRMVPARLGMVRRCLSAGCLMKTGISPRAESSAGTISR